MKKVYYSVSNYATGMEPNKLDNFLATGYITNVFKDLKEEYKGAKEVEAYLACPAATQVVRNMYAVRAGVAFSIEFTDKPSFKVEVTNKHLDARKDHFDVDQYKELVTAFGRRSFMVRSFDPKFVSYTEGIWLYCEEPIIAEQHPVSYEDTDIANYTGTTIGGYDISRWFRPIQPTLFCKKNTINVKQGDALQYIKFPPGEKIQMIPFKMTPEIFEISKMCVTYKMWEKNKTLNFLYNVFTRNKVDRILAEEIKKNIIK